MESNWQLDAIGRPALQVVFIVWAFVLAPLSLKAQTIEARIDRLFQQHRWQEIVQIAPPLGESSDVDLDYGIALAKLGKWSRANNVLRDGLRLHSNDQRFLVELAGVAFKQGDYPRAQGWLEQAVRASPHDSYNLDFLATVFYLEGNLEAAVKYWNRIGRPKLASVNSEPAPQLRPALLDRALGISPATTLELPDLLKAKEQIRQLDLFSEYRFDLRAESAGDFNLVFNNWERNGCAPVWWECLVLIFGQSPARTITFNYFNIGQRAINFRSAFRWDAEKRRVTAQIEAPVGNMPKWHWGISTDIRNENWGIIESFTGPTRLLGALNLKREAVTFQFSNVMSGRWQWFAATEVSDRRYHNVLPGSVLNRTLLNEGAQLKQSFDIRSRLLSWPERRFVVNSGASFSAARLWASGDFAKLQGSLTLHWLPQHSGKKYELQDTSRAGRTFGSPPFDELLTLGVLGDTDLLMKAHIATRDGKKGSAPLGRNYFLSNFEATRNFSIVSVTNIKVGPFVDTGKIYDPITTLGSQKWLWDVGLEAKVDLFGFGVTFSYGHDLRAGHNAFVAFAP